MVEGRTGFRAGWSSSEHEAASSVAIAIARRVRYVFMRLRSFGLTGKLTEKLWNTVKERTRNGFVAPNGTLCTLRRLSVREEGGLPPRGLKKQKHLAMPSACPTFVDEILKFFLP